MWLRKLWEAPRHGTPEQRTRVVVDEVGIRCIRPDGEVHEVGWAGRLSVAVETNDGGPFVEDVYYHLVGPAYSFYVPQSAQGADLLVDRILQLPGLDGRAFSSAMCCTDVAYFPCWHKAGV